MINFINRRVDFQIKMMERFNKCKGLIDFMCWEDLGTQIKLMISPMYIEKVKAHTKMFADLAEDYSIPTIVHMVVQAGHSVYRNWNKGRIRYNLKL